MSSDGVMVLQLQLADLRKALEAERAARKMAEKEAMQYKLWLDETSKSHDATNAHLERAEHERDTALARVELQDRMLTDWERLCGERDVALQAAETALASARARVKELKGIRAKDREQDTATMQTLLDIQSESTSDEYGKRLAAETALASARATIGRVAEYVGYLEQDIAAARKNREPQTGMHVPYHGAFCSAPISTIKDLERFARSMRDLLTSHPAPVAARTFEHPGAEEVFNTLQATRKAPVAAPCAEEKK